MGTNKTPPSFGGERGAGIIRVALVGNYAFLSTVVYVVNNIYKPDTPTSTLMVAPKEPNIAIRSTWSHDVKPMFAAPKITRNVAILWNICIKPPPNERV